MYTNRGFLARYLILVGLAAAPLAASFLFLLRAGENSPFPEIASEQLKTGALYGPALNQNNFLYKLELAAQARPVIITLGSSRAMQMRREFFNAPFINCGGAMNSLEEGALFLRALAPRHKPAVAVITLDFWWFSPPAGPGGGYDYHENTGDIPTMKKLFAPLSYMALGKLPPDLFWKTAVWGAPMAEIANRKAIGIQAIVNSWGYRPDGSTFYSQVFDRDYPLHDIALATAISAARRGADRYARVDPPSTERMEELERIAGYLTANGVKPVFIFPPIAPSVQDAMRWQASSVASRAGERLEAIGVEFYDFHDARGIGSTDCEFLDGLHGGDVANQRALLRIAENHSSALAPYLRVEAMKRAVASYSGNVISFFPGETPAAEVDFLRLGCVKKAPEGK